MNDIVVVIEVRDATAFAVHPVTGKSGKTWGVATYCSRRGVMALRMTAAEWQEAREDICGARHKFYPFVIDFEKVDQPLAVAKVQRKRVVKTAKKKATK